MGASIVRDISEKNFGQLFKDSFYVIPAYQRAYSWDEYNLRALWDDIRNIRDSGISANSTSSLEITSHFMSSLLVKDVQSQNGEKKRHVVDGQQRMTTIFLFFRAALDTLEDNKENIDPNFYKMVSLELLSVLYGQEFFYDYETKKTTELRTSRLSLHNQDADHPYNVLIAQGADHWRHKHESSKVFKAYHFFKEQLSEIFTSEDEAEVVFKRTIDVALNNLHIIYIPILEHEAPQKIFESVNGLTKKLYAGELVKNYLLLSVPSETESDEIYRKYWAEFDKSNWVENDRDKEMLTKYLYYWVSSMGHKIKNNDEAVYRGFKEVASLTFLSKREAAERVEELSEDIHRSILELSRLEKVKDKPSTRLEVSYNRVYAIKDSINSKSVFIQYLRVIHHLERHFGVKMTEIQYDRLLLPFETYIIRKLMSVGGYSGPATDHLLNLTSRAFTLDRIGDYESIDDYLADTVLSFTRALAKGRDKIKRYEGNEHLFDLIAGNSEIGAIPRQFGATYHGFVRMLLVQVENRLRTNSFTPHGMTMRGDFSLEHWLPQSSSSKTWPLANETGRSIYTNAIGNMCIIPQSINSSLSNRSLEVKLDKVLAILRNEEQENTGLLTFDKVLNLCENPIGDVTWNEAKIEDRGKWLAHIILNEIFPDCSVFTGDIESAPVLTEGTMWEQPLEGQRIVARSWKTTVRGYQLADGTLIIDEAHGMKPVTSKFLDENMRNMRTELIMEAVQKSDDTYHWKGSIIADNRIEMLSAFLGRPCSDIWRLENSEE